MNDDHMLHRTGLLTEAQVRGSKATERLSNKKIQQSHTHTHTHTQTGSSLKQKIVSTGLAPFGLQISIMSRSVPLLFTLWSVHSVANKAPREPRAPSDVPPEQVGTE